MLNRFEDVFMIADWWSSPLRQGFAGQAVGVGLYY